MLFLIQQIVVLIGSLIGGLFDLKTGYIYDWITYPVIVAGVILSYFSGYLLESLGIAAAILGIGYLLYYTGKLGGGDVKLFLGLSLALPFIQDKPFIVLVLFYSAIAGVLVIGSYYSIKYILKGIELEQIKQNLVKAVLLAIALIIYFGFMFSMNLLSLLGVLLLGIPLAIGLIFMVFERGIREKCFLKWITKKQLEEDETIAFDFLNEKQIKKLKLGQKRVFDKKDFALFEKAGLKKIPVYRNLPRFGIFIFIGCLLAILVPDLFKIIYLIG